MAEMSHHIAWAQLRVNSCGTTRLRLAIAALAAFAAILLGPASRASGQDKVVASPAAVQPLSSEAASTHSPSPSVTSAPRASAASTAAPTRQSAGAEPQVSTEGAGFDRDAIISYLGQLIGWYRHLDVEERLAREPADTLFVADDRQMANQIIDLGFDYAHAQATLLKQMGSDTGVAAGASSAGPAANNGGNTIAPAAAGTAAGAVPVSGLNDLIARRNEAQTEIEHAKTQVNDLQASLSRAKRRAGDQLTRQLVAAQGELSLAQLRADSLAALIEFESGNAANGGSSSGLEAQIAELERSFPQTNANQNVKEHPQATSAIVAPSVSAAPENSGILGRAAELMALHQNEQTLTDTIALTNSLLATAEKLRRPMQQQLRDIERQGLTISAQTASSDITTVKQSKNEFEKLTQRHKLVLNALLPLSKQIVLLNLYTDNLGRSRNVMHQRFKENLKSLIIRIGGLVILLIVVFLGAFIWRALAFRYVQDLQRRHQLLQLRRITVIVVIALVLIFDFASELGTLATVMGFAAAGIALALQNVILSLAGYFYVSGRFGIRVGDRVQISGINGDVLEIGFFKMTLMELDTDQYGRQPTGRIVVFPNSVVFQPNSNFSKQLPGSNFTWNELRLTVAPDCDFRLVEKRLVEVVNDVVTRYRDTVQREYRILEREFNMPIETPRPQSRIQLGETGLEMVIRYPAQLQAAVQTSDEIARRVVDAIKREPGLKLVAQGTPTIQNAGEPQAPQPPDRSPDGSPSPSGGSQQPASKSQPQASPRQPSEASETDNININAAAATVVAVAAAESVAASGTGAAPTDAPASKAPQPPSKA